MARRVVMPAQERLVAALGYVFTPLVPIVVLSGSFSRGRETLRHHAAQALIWAPFLLALLVLCTVGMIALVRLDWIFILLFPLVILVPFIPGMIWARAVYMGHDVRPPGISQLAKRLAKS